MGRTMFDILTMNDEKSSWFSSALRYKEDERSLMRSMYRFCGFSDPLTLSDIANYEKYNKIYRTSRKEENWEPYIEKVIFNPPATIVFWKSGGKTVVKCNEPDEYDKAKGVALCYMKKALMNSSGEFNKQLRKAGVYYTEKDKGE